VEAPHYPPASAYHEPEAVAYTLTVADASVAELLATSQAKAAILAVVPDFEKRVSGDIGQHLGNLSLKLLADYTVIDRAAYESIAGRIDGLRLQVSDSYRSDAAR
jgi:hypothetical protein